MEDNIYYSSSYIRYYYYCDSCDLRVTLDKISVDSISCPICGSKIYRDSVMLKSIQTNETVVSC